MSADPIAQFRDALARAGLPAPEQIAADGCLHRFATNGRTSDDSGWYVLHLDGIAAGAFGDWRSGVSETWRADVGRSLTPDEERAHRERVACMRADREAGEAERARQAAGRAAELWRAAQPAPTDHPYLTRKGVQPHGLRVHRGSLVIGGIDCDGALVLPLRDTSGTLCSVEFITNTSEKRYFPGGRIAGCYYAIGQPDGVLCIVEGFATAASVHTATGHAVACASNAGNLLPVAIALREKFPAARIIIAADHDESGTGERAALDAASAADGLVAMPTSAGADWNDVLLTQGVDAVRAGIAATPSDTQPVPDERLDNIELPPIGAYAEGEPRGERDDRPRKSQATQLVELCEDIDLWHADDEPYASLMVDGHRETWPLRSRVMRALLARRYYLAARRAAGRQAIEDALAVLMGRAIHEGDARSVYTRCAGRDDAIYIDLCDAQWRAIEITANGWRIVDAPPVHLIRRRGMLPLPEPVSGGSIDLLHRYLTVREKRDLRAIVAWLVQAYRPTGPYPVLILGGEQGSGKSMTARIIRALVDPSVAPIRAVPRDERDLILAARNGWIISLDNLSGAPPWLSDAMCRLATGGGMSTRELYTDADEIIIDVQRPVCCNGIDAIATRPDLADRAMVVTLDPLPDDARRPEADIWRGFGADAPAIIGAVCDAASCALRRASHVQLPAMPRMADHAVWIEAAAPALGWAAGEYVADYMRARDDIVGAAADDSPVGVALMRLIDRAGTATWTGTATDLLAALAAIGDPGVTHTRAWPASPRAAANAVTRLAPALRARGYTITRARTGHDRQRTYTLAQLGHSSGLSSAPSAASARVAHPADDADGMDDADGTLHLCPSGPDQPCDSEAL